MIVNDDEILPKPIKLYIPEWYKKLTHTTENITVKGCIPFLETLTTGYVIPMHQDLHIKHNITSEEGTQGAYQCPAHHKYKRLSASDSAILNFNYEGEFHATHQLEGSPLTEKNKQCSFHKILNPWVIETPPGYSCLFVPPLNNTDDRFSIIPGIVDTDNFFDFINFPIVINGDKYKTLDTVIKKGTPVAQVIPFKRDNWSMEIIKKTDRDIEKQNSFLYKHGSKFIHKYKSFWWRKKIWK